MAIDTLENLIKLTIDRLVEYRDWTRKAKGRLLQLDFVRFALVGSLGFIINSLCLTLLFGRLHIPILLAQLASAEIALCGNFVLHDRWTYQGSKANRLPKRFVIFQGSTWTGLLITTTVVVVSVNVLKIYYFLGLIFGAALAMVWNYLWTKHIIFKLNQPSSDS